MNPALLRKLLKDFELTLFEKSIEHDKNTCWLFGHKAKKVIIRLKKNFTFPFVQQYSWIYEKICLTELVQVQLQF